MNGNNEEWVSKTQMKKRMDELQDLGMELTRLSDETLKKIGLPEDLMHPGWLLILGKKQLNKK